MENRTINTRKLYAPFLTAMGLLLLIAIIAIFLVWRVRISTTAPLNLDLNFLLILLFILLAIVILISIAGFIFIGRYISLLQDYRSLHRQYQNLLGNKQIVDAELRSARKKITFLETRIKEMEAEASNQAGAS